VDTPRVVIAVADRRFEGRLRAWMKSHWLVERADPTAPPVSRGAIIWITDVPELQRALVRGVAGTSVGVIQLHHNKVSVWAPGWSRETRHPVALSSRAVHGEVIRCWLRHLEGGVLTMMADTGDQLPTGVETFVRQLLFEPVPSAKEARDRRRASLPVYLQPIPSYALAQGRSERTLQDHCKSIGATPSVIRDHVLLRTVGELKLELRTARAVARRVGYSSGGALNRFLKRTTGFTFGDLDEELGLVAITRLRRLLRRGVEEVG